MDIFDKLLGSFGKLTQQLFPSIRPTPADFRRGVRKVHAIGILPDLNSKHVGSFKGSITPMKRRFRGVSRTAKRG